jgi:hypothetical protein
MCGSTRGSGSRSHRRMKLPRGLNNQDGLLTASTGKQLSKTAIMPQTHRATKSYNDGSRRDSFCFGSDEIGYLTRNCIVDRIQVMIWKENTLYKYDRFVTAAQQQQQQQHHDPMRRVKPEWRAQIAKWSYNEVDSFYLSRECVAVSMSIFDRYFAQYHDKTNNNIDAEAVLLVSCATLSISIKLLEVDVLSLGALSRFSRNKYTPNEILDMEWKVVLSLDFHLNPPTTISFAIHFLLLLPNEINEGDRKELFESTRFVVELSVADSFFVAYKPSIIAAAAIIMTLQQPSTLSRSTLLILREIHYCETILDQIGIDDEDSRLQKTQDRLKLLQRMNNT